MKSFVTLFTIFPLMAFALPGTVDEVPPVLTGKEQVPVPLRASEVSATAVTLCETCTNSNFGGNCQVWTVSTLPSGWVAYEN